jgi:hypothetical protein
VAPGQTRCKKHGGAGVAEDRAAKLRLQKIENLKKQAKKLGFELEFKPTRKGNS